MLVALHTIKRQLLALKYVGSTEEEVEENILTKGYEWHCLGQIISMCVPRPCHKQTYINKF